MRTGLNLGAYFKTEMPTNFVGNHVVAFDLSMPRLWDYIGNNTQHTQYPIVRKDVGLGLISSSKKVVIVRVPINFTPLENQMEALTDFLCELGFKMDQAITMKYGLYGVIWYFSR